MVLRKPARVLAAPAASIIAGATSGLRGMSQVVLGHSILGEKTSLPALEADNGSTSEPSEGEPTVFISYSRKDLGFVDRLEAALRARGIKTLVDRIAIEVGEKWFARLQDLIARAETIIFVLSPDSVASAVCAQEVAHGKRLGKRFIPVVARKIETPNVPEALSELNYVFLDDEKNFATQLDRLIRAIRTDLAWMRMHADLGRTAEEWSSAGRPRGLLFGGTRLRAAQNWIANRPTNAPLPTDETRSFILASRKAARQWRDGLIGTLAFGLVLAIGLAVLAFWQRQLAEQSRAAAHVAADGLTRNVARRMRTLVGIPQQVVRDVLEQAEGVLVSLETSSRDDRFTLSHAEMLIEFSDTLYATGDIWAAKSAAEKALRFLATPRYEKSDETGVWALQARCLESLSNTLRISGNLDAAETHLQDALSHRHRIFEAKKDEQSEREVAIALDRIGDLKRTDREFGDAMRLYDLAKSIRERRSEGSVQRDAWMSDLSWSFNRIADTISEISDHHFLPLDDGNSSADPERWQRALLNYRSALEIREYRSAASPYDSRLKRDLAWSLTMTGFAEVHLNARRQDGERNVRRAIKILDELLITDSLNTDYLRDRAISYAALSNAYLALSPDEAMSWEAKALDERVRLTKLAPDNGRWLRDLFFGYLRARQLARIIGEPEKLSESDALARAAGLRAQQALPNDAELSRRVKEEFPSQ